MENTLHFIIQKTNEIISIAVLLCKLVIISYTVLANYSISSYHTSFTQCFHEYLYFHDTKGFSEWNHEPPLQHPSFWSTKAALITEIPVGT